MKRIRIVALCLVAVFAVGGITASSALAAKQPHFGRCLKKAVAGGAGFTGATCTTPVGTGAKYEWTSTIVKNKFHSKIKPETSATLETVGGTKITCTEEEGPGEVLNSTEIAKVEPKFNNCASSGLKCKSAGAVEGEIKTAPLGGVIGIEKITLVEGKEVESKNKVAGELHAEGGGNIAEFACGGLSVVTKGSVLHNMKSNAMYLTATEKFVASKGEQKPDKFAGGTLDEHTLESNTNGGPFEEAGQTITAINTGEEKVEASSVN